MGNGNTKYLNQLKGYSIDDDMYDVRVLNVVKPVALVEW